MLNTARAIHAFRSHSRDVAAIENHRTRFASPSRDIQQTCEELWSRRGKRLRPHLVFWFGRWMKAPLRELETCAWAIEAVHTASLLHDDVIDNATLRRGAPSLNVQNGNRISILSGDYLLSEAVCQVAQLASPTLVQALCEAVKELASGEALQHEQQNKIPNDWETYERIHRLKTSSLLTWSATVGPRLQCPNKVRAVEEFMTSFGHLFQFTDDLIDLYGGGGKETLGDIKEGNVNSACWLICQQDSSLRSDIKSGLEGDISAVLPALHAALKKPRARKTLKIQLKAIRATTDRLALAIDDPKMCQALRSITELIAKRTLL